MGAEKVLVVTVDTQMGLAVAQSLGRKGVEVHGVGVSPRSIGFYSRYVKGRHVLPNWKWGVSDGEYARRVIEIIQREGITHVMAISERLLLLFNEHREEIEKHARLLIHRPEMLDKVFDKEKTLDAAKRVGIPIPRTLFLGKGEGAERLEGVEALGFPLVVKPVCRTYMQRQGAERDFKILYIYSREALEEKVEALRPHPLMIQEYCRGKGLTLCAHRFRSKIQALFQYRVLHAYPPLGGYSIYRESTAIDPLAKDYAVRLLDELDWEGHCEIEFLREASGTIKFMEVNGRFWGALPLAVKAGVDFPFLTFQAWARGREARIDAYPVGLRCCLLGGELNWILAYLKSDRGVREKMGGVLEFLGSFSPAVRHDVQSLDDPLPGIMDPLFIVGNAFRRLPALFQRKQGGRTVETDL